MIGAEVQAQVKKIVKKSTNIKEITIQIHLIKKIESIKKNQIKITKKTRKEKIIIMKKILGKIIEEHIIMKENNKIEKLNKIKYIEEK